MKAVVLCLLCLVLAPNVAAARDRWWPPKVEWMTWGSILTPPSVHERARDNTKAELYLRSQVTLVRWSEDTSLVGYAIFGVLKDRNVFTYNNKASLSIGIQISHKLTKAVKLSFGARWSIEQQFSTGVRNSAVQFTLDGSLWKTWKPDWLKRRLPEGSQLVLSGWGNFRYPAALNDFEKDNGLLQGEIKFALDMPIRQSRVKASPFISLKAKWDIRKRSYNNLVAPAIGLDLKLPFGERGQVTLGIKAVHEMRYETGTTRSGGIAYVAWYRHF